MMGMGSAMQSTPHRAQPGIRDPIVNSPWVQLGQGRKGIKRISSFTSVKVSLELELTGGKILLGQQIRYALNQKISRLQLSKGNNIHANFHKILVTTSKQSTDDTVAEAIRASRD